MLDPTLSYVNAFRESLPHLRFSSKAFEIIFLEAFNAHLDDCIKATYIPNPETLPKLKNLSSILEEQSVSDALAIEDSKPIIPPISQALSEDEVFEIETPQQIRRIDEDDDDS